MKAYGTGFTDIGKLRPNNEDALLVDNALGLFIVSDGMGGHAAGDVAAREAVSAVASYVRAQARLLERIRAGQVSQALLSSIVGIAVARACRHVYMYACEHPETVGMGCTLTVLLIGRSKAAMAHVGDSRLYLERHGKLRQLSVDHSVAEEFARRGLISREEIPLVPQGHALARAVGVRESVEVDEMLFQIRPSDRFILCSDGVWGYLEDPRDMEEFMFMLEPDEVAESLVTFANSAGGHDNATAVVVDVRATTATEERAIADSLESSITLELLEPVKPAAELRA